MSDSNQDPQNQNQPTPTPATNPQPEPSPGEPKPFTPITSQKQFDAMTQERIDRATKPYADYEDIKSKAEKFDALGITPEEAAKLAKDNEALQQRIRQGEWRQQVQGETGVPASVIRGETLEEMQQHAASISAAFAGMQPKPTAPIVPSDTGGSQPPAMTKDDILAIENEAERMAAIEAHLELF